MQCSLDRLLPYHSLQGIDGAVRLLADTLARDARILIVADFDADGATSCALAVRALRALGACSVDYVVPDRFRFGYGLTPEIVELARQRRPDLLITVDNGVSSLAGVRRAKEAGMHVLITDHHLAGRELPEADAIVNPNCPGDAFASKNLAGVGVIFYVMAALRAHLREQGWFVQRGIACPNLAELLDLVALGTVADVVALDANNRILVEQGLRRVRAGRACAGIQALLQVAGRDPRRAVAADFGFAVGPRLNAAGRLEDMSIGIECLLSDAPAEAAALATQLDALNKERREIEDEMREQALQVVRQAAVDSDGQLPYSVCLFDAQWHQGVVGLVAARIKERLHRPVIAFAPADAGDIKGSARSIPGLHIRDTLDDVAAQHPGLIDRFGGHAMAAGLSLARDRLEEFRQAWDGAVRARVRHDDLENVLWSDGELEDGQLDLATAETLRAAGPWGQGFPAPLFDGEFEVLDSRVVGEAHCKLRVRPRSGTVCLEAIAFQGVERFGVDTPTRVRLAYRLEVNEYQGRAQPQLVIEHLEAVD